MARFYYQIAVSMGAIEIQLRPRKPLDWIGTSVVAMIVAQVPARAQLGDSLTGAGPINRSMGGATVAAPIDSAGALCWNPASIAALVSSEMEAGLELLVPRSSLSSRVAAGALGPGLPAQSMVGATASF